MGFTTGFAGGAALTLAVAYMSTLSQQRAREQQSLLVQQQSETLDSAVDHPPAPRRPTRAELAAAARANFTDRAKDRWNAEVEGAVRWLQDADWDRARERVEERMGVLAGTSGAEAAAERAKNAVIARGAEVKEEIGDIVERSIGKGRDVVGEVESAAGDAAVRTESNVEKALRQRYEKPAQTKTVAEVLRERYLPMDQRDNTVLRGI